MHGNRRSGCRRRWTLPLAVFLLAASHSAAAQTPAPPAAPARAFIQQGQILKLTPATRESDLARLPNHQVIETKNGARLRMKTVRSLLKVRARLQARRGIRNVPAVNPGARTVPVRGQADLANALRLPPATVLQLPDGRKLTAGQLQRLRPHLERKTGRSLAAAARPGRTTRVARGTSLDTLLKKPDNEVLVSPGGKRVTVGALRAYLRQHPEARGGRGPAAARGPLRTADGRSFGVAQRRQVRQLPDSQRIVLANGRQTTLGELRRQIRLVHAAGTRVRPPDPGRAMIRLPNGRKARLHDIESRKRVDKP